MNETMKTLKERRSIRNFRKEQVNDQDLQAILDVAQYAPNAGGQPWHFSVIQDKKLIDALSNDSKEVAQHHEEQFLRELANQEDFHAFYNAPTVIVVSGEEKNLWSPVDCAAANQNMLLAAEALGLAGCWVNFGLLAFSGEKAEGYRMLLKVPENYKPLYSVALGYRNGEVPIAAPRKQDVVSYQ